MGDFWIPLWSYQPRSWWIGSSFCCQSVLGMWWSKGETKNKTRKTNTPFVGARIEIWQEVGCLGCLIFLIDFPGLPFLVSIVFLGGFLRFLGFPSMFTLCFVSNLDMGGPPPTGAAWGSLHMPYSGETRLEGDAICGAFPQFLCSAAYLVG